MRKCVQDKCAFNNGVAGCRRCDECGVCANWVNDNCERCMNCENKEGEARWNDDEKKEKQDNKEKQLVEVKC